MKPKIDEYRVAASVDEALEALSRYGEDCRPIAGGQSLVPLLNFRLAQIARLIDINHIPELRSIELEDRRLVVGAGVRQAELERYLASQGSRSLLLEALGFVGHPVIRNRGTVVGSLAHADPAAELPLALLLLGGSVRVRGPDGDRDIPAQDFTLGTFHVAVEPDELILHAAFDLADHQPGFRGVFDELTIRHGDFALAAAGIVLGGASLRVGVAGVDTVPRVFTFDRAAADEPEDVARDVATSVDPSSDIHASADFRRKAAEVLVRRGIERVVNLGRD